MKKETLAIIIIIILMSLVFGVQATNAEELSFNMNDYRTDFKMLNKPSSLGSYENNYNRAYEHYKQKCEGVYDKYIIGYGGFGTGWGENQVDLFCYNESDNAITPGLTFGYWNEYGNRFYLSLAIYKSAGKKDYYVRHFYNETGLTSDTYSNTVAYHYYNYFNLSSGELNVTDNHIFSTNIDFHMSSENNGIDSRATAITEFTFGNTTLSSGDLIYSEGEYVTDELTLKKTFNSGTNAGAMGKIVWDINAYGDVAAMDGLIPFKIQFGSNDFTIKNMPKFSSYKIYGSNSFESGWDDITNDERFYFDEFNFEKYTLEGSLTETIMTSTLNIPSEMCVYENIKVEFYFDNTSNFYLYTFDDMSTNFNEGWSDVEYYFNDYIYYEFPTTTRYAFISSKTIDNIKGEIYFPYNFLNNNDSLLGGYMFDYINNNVLYSIDDVAFEENDYYHYFDFDYTLSQGQILFLERKTETEEVPYFYLHKDYFVEFRDEVKFEIQSPNGWISIDTGSIDNPYSKVENENKDFSFDEILDFFNKIAKGDNPLFNYINEVYKKIRSSKLGNYILIIIVSSIIILLIKSLKR